MSEPHQHRQVAESFGSDAERYNRARPGHPGALVERIVFLPYTREIFAATQEWARERDLFPETPSLAGYDEAAMA